MSRRILLVACALMTASCAHGAATPKPAESAAPVAMLTAADTARCAEVDARQAALPLSKLQPSRSRTRGTASTGTRPPGTTTGPRIRAVYLVRADGTVDMSTVRFDGPATAQSKESLLAVIARQPMIPPTLEGCPVRGRGEMIAYSFTTTRVVRMGRP